MPTLRHRRTRGFSLVEMLVGVVLALVATIVVMQIFQLNEQRQRSTTSGSAAVMDGAIAITELQREVRQSGMGLSSFNAASNKPVLLGCSLTLPSGVVLPALAPVTINSSVIPAGDANTDTLLILYASGNGAPEGNRVQAQPAPTIYNVNTPSAFAALDYVIAAPTDQASPCSLLLDRVTAVNGVSAGGTVTTTTGSTAGAQALFDWGKAPRLLAYRVSGGRLMQCNFMEADCSGTGSGTWTEVQDGVVSLRAQYGRDTDVTMDGRVNDFDQATPSLSCGWARTAAVRLALTVRNGQYEKQAITGSGAGQSPVPTWSGNEAAAIDLTEQTGWDHYRYRVFEAVIPLRNVAWMGGISGCNNIGY